MLVSEAVALVFTLLRGVKAALDAGKNEVSEADVDAAFAEIKTSDDALSDAIRRARERGGS